MKHISGISKAVSKIYFLKWLAYDGEIMGYDQQQCDIINNVGYRKLFIVVEQYTLKKTISKPFIIQHGFIWFFLSVWTHKSHTTAQTWLFRGPAGCIASSNYSGPAAWKLSSTTQSGNRWNSWNPRFSKWLNKRTSACKVDVGYV